MLTYRNTSIVLFVFAVIFFGAGLYNYQEFVLIYFGLIFFYILVIILGASNIRMNYYLKAYIRGDKSQPKVSLTFDDGPNAETTPQILKILKKHNVKAAFFCIGKNIEANKTILKRISDEGHMIGNHSWSHSYFFDFYLPGKMAKDIIKTNKILGELPGTQYKLFRPPYGVTNPFVARALKKTGHKVIGWSLKTFDTVRSEKQVLSKLENNIKNGDIVLLHDTNKKVVDILDKAIESIKRSGKEIVGLDELLKLKI